jgi:phosphoribosylanthranilate isomerase
MKNLLKKVCGLTSPDNIRVVSALEVDLLGFIFYPPSPRFVGAKMTASALKNLSTPQQKTGVFVNASVEEMLSVADVYGLQVLQLHGQESPETCHALRKSYPVLKAISVGNVADLAAASTYEGACDYVLFDTKGPGYGGNGVAFDWAMLDAYTGNTPFFLSGGIAPGDAAAIEALQHPKLAGIDLNSRFESSPGIKNIELLETFLTRPIF